ncbi:MAG: preprotein translocase subunit SecA [Candidatus Nealsonbacteria bacterium RIFCSPLOWO2_01_FULL_43_32]|uniref:Protein translocase subunit SecA n=1 Tax=Candidatus Nealsonbacteria bacterium RIFCSPLOWO2_01_FULL_43_32 TaxID=1801672 RepID=A0A1G2EF31_9BACT|nr:MAG: preprotein translocase subunit SecA [Candidatus Nealsonbacteria bacterium RIFCSPLOWO2_01_FULL_43_32]
MSILTKVFGDANEKYIKKLQPVVEKINNFEKEFEGFSDEKLKEKTNELKLKLSDSRSHLNIEDLLPEAFALVREASKRTLNQRHFDVQLIGGVVLHQGKIAEMKTGEGKTLAATLPVYLNALEGKGVHVVTVNDYLAKRDMVWMGQIYYALGLSVGCIVHEAAYIYDPLANKDKERDMLGGFKVVEDYLRPCSRQEAYSADITYGTNNEFGFDYLRDNMVYELSQQVQRGHHFAIVDEVDSILIDEARTPLIISAPDMESSNWYQEFSRLIPKLDQATDYEIDEKLKAVTLTEIGVNKIEETLGMGNIYEEKGIKYVHHLEQALRAQALFKRDRDYVVKNNEVIIVDEFTGRLMPGRRWSGGLHQAIEAKEGVRVQPESLTLASITFQNYFRMYQKLAGMTGTAATSAEEFDKVYRLDVVVVPTNKPMRRKLLPDRIYKSVSGKFQALVKEVKQRHEKGQPILVGTTSIEKNEYLGKLLEREGVPHQILNAKQHEKEGEIIAQAGRLGAVTIATNMAGRGVDIILGGNPEDDPERSRRVRELGGLHVIGTERHEARRVDNQLRGRSGRQGDPGSSQFFVALEDDLMRIFGGDRIKSLMGLLKVPEDEAIEAKMISSAIESAQSKIEGMHFDARRYVLEYDDVLNKHREVIYRKRKEFLQETEDCLPTGDVPQGQKSSVWAEKLRNWLRSPEEKDALENKVKELGDNFDKVAKVVALRTLDMLWMNHLEEMESLRDSVGLRAYGQRDPLVEYKTEGHRMFQKLLSTLDSSIASTILKVSLKEQPKKVGLPVEAPQSGAKAGRNDPCPCGATHPDGRPIKYKHCHGK